MSELYDVTDINALINYLNITHPDEIKLSHDDVEQIVQALDYYKDTFNIG